MGFIYTLFTVSRCLYFYSKCKITTENNAISGRKLSIIREIFNEKMILDYLVHRKAATRNVL